MFFLLIVILGTYNIKIISYSILIFTVSSSSIISIIIFIMILLQDLFVSLFCVFAA